MTGRPDARPADRIPVGKTFRRAEIRRLKGERERLRRRIAFAEAARDKAAARAESLRRELADISGRVDALEAAE